MAVFGGKMGQDRPTLEQVLAQNDSKAGKKKVFKFLEASLGPLCSLSSPGGAPFSLHTSPQGLPGPPRPHTSHYQPYPLPRAGS